MNEQEKEKYNLIEETHELMDYESLSHEYLASVTDEDMEEYEKVRDKYVSAYNADVHHFRKDMGELYAKAMFLFGNDSKEARYLRRKTSYSDSENIITRHYKTPPYPADIARRVEKSKEIVKAGLTKVSSSGGEQDVKLSVEASTYLLNKGFIYGKDFEAHNAVDIYKTKLMEDFSADLNEVHILDGCKIDSGSSKVSDKWSVEVADNVKFPKDNITGLLLPFKMNFISFEQVAITRMDNLGHSKSTKPHEVRFSPTSNGSVKISVGAEYER